MVHQAKYLSDKLADPAYEGEFNILVMKAEAEDFRMVYEAEKAVVEEAAKMLNELASDRAWADLALRIMSYRARVDSLKEPWQSRLAEVLDTAESRLPDDE
jgi:regulator of protease activity HflC (stomatin/prohibitin superfamily)